MLPAAPAAAPLSCARGQRRPLRDKQGPRHSCPWALAAQMLGPCFSLLRTWCVGERGRRRGAAGGPCCPREVAREGLSEGDTGRAPGTPGDERFRLV